MAFLNLFGQSLSKKKHKHKDKSTDPGTGRHTMIKVDEDTDKPGKAWERLKESNVRVNLPVDFYLHQPRHDKSLRFVCLSDTHCCIEKNRVEFHKRIPDGDVLIHCGDFSIEGSPSEITAFDSFMARLPHPVKLVIAGNHEMTFQRNMCDAPQDYAAWIQQQLGLPVKATEAEVCTSFKQLLQHQLYLEDETIEICGIKIYGSPWVPEFGCSAFSARRGERLLEIWNGIPSDTDILVTHGPPCGYGDLTEGEQHAGCVELLNTVVHRVKPKFHVFGHIHSGYGMCTNNTTTFINSAICDNRYKPAQDPIVFDYPLPKGFSRKDFEQLTTESLREARAKRIAEERGSSREEDGCDDTAEAGTTATARAAVLSGKSISNGHLSSDSPFAVEHNARAKLLGDIQAAGKRKALTESTDSQKTLATCAELLSGHQSSCNTVKEVAGAGIQSLDKTDAGTSAGADCDGEVDFHTDVNIQLKGDSGSRSGCTVKKDANSLQNGSKQTRGGTDVQSEVVDDGSQGTKRTGIRALIARFESGIKLNREKVSSH